MSDNLRRRSKRCQFNASTRGDRWPIYALRASTKLISGGGEGIIGSAGYDFEKLIPAESLPQSFIESPYWTGALKNLRKLIFSSA